MKSRLEQAANGAFVWDYPSKGFVFDKWGRRFGLYPKYITSLDGFILQVFFFGEALEKEIDWILEDESEKLSNEK